MTEVTLRPLLASVVVIVVSFAGCISPTIRVEPQTVPPQTVDPVNDSTTTEPAVGDPPAEEPRVTERAAIDEPSAPEPVADETFATDPVTESPLDELAKVEPELTPESVARNRELVSETPTFDIPIEINESVLGWVERYSRTHRRSFEAGLRRSGRYLTMFREIFAEEGLPQDLVYMAHVESGYKTSAYSRAHARGIFQFIASTARHYGLRVDTWADERADPERSARAAARYMKRLYAEFDDWYLALAAYNAGEGKIRRAIERTGKRDFWSLARTRSIRRETKNHIPAILAATLISKEPGKYGLSFVPDPPLEYDTIVVEGAADLRLIARCAGTDIDSMRRLNPALRQDQTPPDGAFAVRVPAGMGPIARATLEPIPASERVLYTRHRIRSGETLSGIARRYGVSVRSIQQVNDMGRSTLIRANRTLLVPTSSASRYVAVGVDAPGAVNSGEAVSYNVRRGDTLYAIARRYRTTAASVAAANRISMNEVLRVGQRLTVVPGLPSSSTARSLAAGASSNGDQGGKVVHTVRRGDTLWRIANLYRTTVKVLCSLNEISPGATLYPGVKLTVGYR